MGLLKYFGEPGGDNSPHSAPLLWPGTPSGFPVRGSPPRDFRQGDQEAHHVGDYHAESFRLWMEEDYRRFTWIMDRVCNNWFKILKRDDFWQPEQEAFLVWLEWLQIYGEYAETTRGGGNVPGTQSRPAPPPQHQRAIDAIPLVDDFPGGQVV